MGCRVRATVSLLVACLNIVRAGGASAQPAETRVSRTADLEVLQSAFADLADRLRPSVVAIQAERPVPISPARQGPRRGNAARLLPAAGSGVVIREDGMILTNDHVVRGAERITVVLHDGSSHEVTDVRSDPRSDLAIVQIEADGLQPARLGDLSEVRQGHWAFTLGNPFGLAADGGVVMSHGIVSAIGRKLQLDPGDARYYGNLIQTSAAVNPGNSGGPLVNIDGEVIGITTAISTRTGANEGVGFAIPMEARTKGIINKLLRGEPVEYGYLGVITATPPQATLRTLTGAPARGATIERVEPNTPAQRVGLSSGDLICEFDGVVVEDADHLARLVGSAPIDRPLPMCIRRQGQQMRIQVVLCGRTMSDRIRPTKLTWRGMTLSEANPGVRDRLGLPRDAVGIFVIEVEPRSAGERAGVKPGYRINSIGNSTVQTLEQARELLTSSTRSVSLTLGDGQKVEVGPE